MLGLATASSTVTMSVDGTPQSGTCERGEYFRKEVTVANSSAPKWTKVTVSAGGTATPDAYQFTAKDDEEFGAAGYPGYDADGNLLRDGRWKYTWDTANRLTKMEPSDYVAPPTGSRRKLEFKYDALGRRIWKKVTNLEDSSVTETRFLYDGWNLLAELSGASGTTTVRTYLWGSDLSGSLQGAGGVGGLLAVRPTSSGFSHFAGYDGNGNLTLLVDGNTGLASAAYEYGPFGEPLRVTGPLAAANPFAFSTKFTDRESGYLYYGYNYYSPSLGRWLNRDRIEENGGLPLYGFVGNAPSVGIDPFGDALYAFDGTNNEKLRDYPKGDETNVAVLSDIYTGTAFYRAGNGTTESRWWLNAGGNVGGYGGQERLDWMMVQLRRMINYGDRDIHIIDFSRGAALAREFTNRIVDEYPCIPIQWMGLFDTVGSFGIGGNDIDIGIRLGIPPSVERVFHITAGDEHRYFFPLASIRQGPGLPTRFPNWDEIVLPGAHSDIGGGYHDHRGLANISLAAMHADGVNNGVPFGPAPEKYKNTSDRYVHDSRWINDKYGPAWLARWMWGDYTWINGGFMTDRNVFYHP